MEWWNGGMVEWMHVLYQVHFWCMLAITAGRNLYHVEILA